MLQLQEQIRKAAIRAGSWDPAETAERARTSTPAELNSPKRLATRKRFLDVSLGETRDAKEFLERIIHGNELQDVNYLARGSRAAEAISRVVVRDPSGRITGYGTGFLVTPRLLLTNHHVLPDRRASVRSTAEFRYERDLLGRALDPIGFSIVPDEFFYSHEELDFALVAVAPRSERDGHPLARFGYLPLIATLGKVVLGEWLTIIQHPSGERKQVCVRENQLLRIDSDVLWYSTDTLGGSSGAPVFNNDWTVVALHHSGVPERKEGRIQTIDGRDWNSDRDGEDQIKWVANEGIRVSRIVGTLRDAIPEHPLLQPIFEATPADVHRTLAMDSTPSDKSAPTPISPSTPSAPRSNPMKTSDIRHLNLRLELAGDGRVSVISANAEPLESMDIARERRSSPRRRSERIDVPFDATYQDRKGFNPGFLGTGAKRVNLPSLTDAVREQAAELINSNGEIELKYHNFSVVMNKIRRLAIFSAANVRADQRYALSRSSYSGESDWRPDRRISENHQLTNFYYRGNRFDRGHLTRNEDLEFGPTPLAAMQSSIDTLHYTNIVPQHDAFNRSNLHDGDDPGDLELGIWGDIEKHILEGSILSNHFAAQVFTGPVLDPGDPDHPEYDNLPYPLRFWKVVAALDRNGQLFATAFLLDQSEAVDRLGLDETAPFEPFRNYQVPIAEIERLTGLLFTSGTSANPSPLSMVDPLGTTIPRRRSSRNRFDESTAAESRNRIPESYLHLHELGDVVMP